MYTAAVAWWQPENGIQECTFVTLAYHTVSTSELPSKFVDGAAHFGQAPCTKANKSDIFASCQTGDLCVPVGVEWDETFSRLRGLSYLFVLTYPLMYNGWTRTLDTNVDGKFYFSPNCKYPGSDSDREIPRVSHVHPRSRQIPPGDSGSHRFPSKHDYPNLRNLHSFE